MYVLTCLHSSQRTCDKNKPFHLFNTVLLLFDIFIYYFSNDKHKVNNQHQPAFLLITPKKLQKRLLEGSWQTKHKKSCSKENKTTKANPKLKPGPKLGLHSISQKLILKIDIFAHFSIDNNDIGCQYCMF